MVSRFSGKKVETGLRELYQRVEKHTEMDDNRLLQVVWREMQDEFIRQYTHYDNLIERCYTGTNVRMEFSLQVRPSLSCLLIKHAIKGLSQLLHGHRNATMIWYFSLAFLYTDFSHFCLFSSLLSLSYQCHSSYANWLTYNLFRLSDNGW